MGNSILFPAPKPTYSEDAHKIETHLVWIPDKTKKVTEHNFPALIFFDPVNFHTLLYFHGNSADLGDIYGEMEMIHRHCYCNVLAIEYPGYGLCAELQPTPSIIDSWGRAAFHWLMNRGVIPTSIIPFGRSIGTGPAAKLASCLKVEEGIPVGGLILQQPYTTIHKLVSDYSSLGTWIIPNYWDTEKALSSLSPSTPLLIMHGENDEVIPVKHGKSLFAHFNAPLELKEGVFFADSPHNDYLVNDHLAVPIRNFLYSRNVSRQADQSATARSKTAATKPRRFSLSASKSFPAAAVPTNNCAVPTNNCAVTTANCAIATAASSEATTVKSGSPIITESAVSISTDSVLTSTDSAADK